MNETDTSQVLFVPVQSATTPPMVIAPKRKLGIVTRIASVFLLIVLMLVWLAITGVMVMPSVLVGGKK